MTRPRVHGVRQTTANFRRAATLLGAPLNSASRQALTPVLAQVKALAPIATLKRTAKIQRVKGSARTAPRYRVGFVAPGNRLAHLVEFGTAPHSLAKGARRRTGHLQDRGPFSPGTPARPFVRPAFDSVGINRIVSTFQQAFFPAWERNLKRLEIRAAKRAAARR